MVYKSGIKEWAITFWSCGLIYGAVMGLYYNDINMGIFLGALFGILFTVCMVIFSTYMEKKAERFRAEVKQEKKIICEGPANHKKGANAIGGWLFLTEDSIIFYPHKMNFSGQKFSVSVDNIANIETKSNQLKLHTKTGETYAFVVNKANLWIQSISGII